MFTAVPSWVLTWRTPVTCFVVFVLACVSVQAQDSVFIFKPDGKPAKVNGKITKASPEGVTVDGKLVQAATIRKITIGREPNELNRARDNFDSGQYADCVQQLDKLESPSNALLKADVDFMRAYSNAQISLRGGNVAPQDAGRKMGEFIGQNPQSYHLYPAIDAYAQLIFAFGKPELAAEQFKKLHTAEWVEYRLKGRFYYGRMNELVGNLDEATRSYDAILRETGTDDFTQTYKLLAEIEKTKLAGVGGDPTAGINALTAVVGKENQENQLLFGYLFNALGALQLKAGNRKAAMMSYLKTQLLYPQSGEARAEAIYRLTKIWPDLSKNDRANDAREILKSQYRNSYWSQKK